MSSVSQSKKSSEKLSAGQAYFDIFLFAFSIVVLVLAYQISGFGLSEPGTFPLASSSVMVLSLGAVLLGNRKKQKSEDSFGVQLKKAANKLFTREFLIFASITILYIIAVEPLHFLASSFIFLTLSIVVLKGSKPLFAVLISSGMLAFIYVVFLYFFKVILP